MLNLGHKILFYHPCTRVCRQKGVPAASNQHLEPKAFTPHRNSETFRSPNNPPYRTCRYHSPTIVGTIQLTYHQHLHHQSTNPLHSISAECKRNITPTNSPMPSVRTAVFLDAHVGIVLQFSKTLQAQVGHNVVGGNTPWMCSLLQPLLQLRKS